MGKAASPALTSFGSDVLTTGGAADRFLTSQEVAELLQVSKNTIEAMARAGQIPAKQVGRFWRFRRSAIEAWFDAQEDD
jgi:excisionase family DNA binding protein